MRTLTIDRRKNIIEALYRTGSVKASELAEQHGVGIETIRRDLKELVREFDIELTYGGAYIKNYNSLVNIREEPLSVKRAENSAAKNVIAKKAAALICAGDTIAFNSGSTNEYVLDYLDGKTPLSLLTLDVNIASRASRIEGVDVYIPGGKVRHNSGIAVGTQAKVFISMFNIDKLFFGVSAVSLQKGLTHPVLEEIESNRALLDTATKRYLMADTSKFDKVGLLELGRLEEFDAVIVDDAFPEEYRRFMALHEIGVI